MNESLRNYQLEKLFYAGPVTSLYFHNDAILLAGTGPYLKAFYLPTSKLLASCIVLENNRIYRIVPGKNYYNEKNCGNKSQCQSALTEHEHQILAIYGAKTIQIVEFIIMNPVGKGTGLPLCTFTLRTRLSPLRDWILDVQWLYEPNQDVEDILVASPNITSFGKEKIEIAVAFAHNFVEIWDPLNMVCVYYIQCQERCVLYSARFFGDTRKELLLASGTVFNQVHIWNVTKKDQNGDGIVVKKLVGHEGVIFGIRFNQNGSSIASVSDDRTIRVWKTAVDEKKKEPLVLFGHMARVWDCLFVENYLISISEDSTCRVWQNTIDENTENLNNDCLACWEGHVGKNVWSVAVNPSKKIIATGGQDSGIRLWSLLSISKNKIDSDEDLIRVSLPPLEDYINLKENNQFQPTFKEHIRNFVLVDYLTIVVATNYGYLMRYHYENKQWLILYRDIDLMSYNMMTASRCGRIISCGSIKGHVFIVSPWNEFEPIKQKIHDLKIFEIFIEASEDKDLHYVISHAVHNDIHILQLDLKFATQPTLKPLYKLSLPPDFLLLSLAVCPQYNLLMCGSRESGLAIYHLWPFISSSSNESAPNFAPILYISKSHGKQAVTCITWKIQQTSDNENILLIYTSGRDGEYIKYRLRELRSLLEHPKPIQLLEIPEMENTDRNNLQDIAQEDFNSKTLFSTSMVRKNNELLLLGFYRKRFFIYNEERKFQMFSVACGGAHRVWHFKAANKRLDKATFAFIRKENVYLYARRASALSEGFDKCKLQENFHGREARSIEYLSYSWNGSQTNCTIDPIIFATGAEDSTLRLFQYVPGQKENCLRNLCNIKKHTSVIRTIQWSLGKELLLFSSGACEELRCWKVEMTIARGTHLDIDSLASQISPLMNVNCLEWTCCPTISEIPETRIMDTSVFPIDPANGLHLIAAVYSDAILRVWIFDEGQRHFLLVGQSSFHQKCILHVKHLLIPGQEEGKNQIILLTCATDGRIAIWDVSKTVYGFLKEMQTTTRDEEISSRREQLQPTLRQPLHVYKAHQSGVNCLDVHQIPTDMENFMLVTGGDDNAIGVAILRITTDTWENSEISLKTVIKSDCYIKDLTLITGGASQAHGSSIQDKTTFLTMSLDQRVNLWKVVQKSESSFEILLIDSQFLDVADPSALGAKLISEQSDSNIQIGIVGIGIEIFHIKLQVP
ncbi:hypothetical protein G9A89_019180 [Geosiphon pyriformis]|nr:hypothetical protein G9A89_019180 [Geosiphon pyriformis]